MINEELKKYIEQALTQEKSEEWVISTLTDKGWNRDDVINSISQVKEDRREKRKSKLLKIFAFSFLAIFIIVVTATLYNLLLKPKLKIQEYVKNNITEDCLADKNGGELSRCNVKISVSDYKSEWKYGKATVDGRTLSWVGSINEDLVLLIWWEGEHPLCSEVIDIPTGSAKGITDVCIYKDALVNRADTNNPSGYLVDRAETIDIYPGYSISFDIPAGYIGFTEKDGERVEEIVYSDAGGNKLIINFNETNTLFSEEYVNKITISGIDFVEPLESSYYKGFDSSAWYPLGQEEFPNFVGIRISTLSGIDSKIDKILYSINFSEALKNSIKTGVGPKEITFFQRDIETQDAQYKDIQDDVKRRLMGINIEEVNNLISESDPKIIFATYNVYENSMSRVYDYDSVSSEIKNSKYYSDLSNPENHKKIIEYIKAVIPKELLIGVKDVMLGTDGVGNVLAAVGNVNPDPTYGLTLFVDIFDMSKYLSWGSDDYIKVITHETIHLLQNREVDSTKTKSDCKTYYIDNYGCVREESYTYNFIKNFWLGKYVDNGQEYGNDMAWEKLEEVYKNNPTDFVSVYATYNPIEDFAESFLSYVWQYNPNFEYEGLVGEKFKFFNSMQGLVRLREEFLQIYFGISDEEEYKTEDLTKEWADKIIKKYNIPVYPESRFVSSTYYPECEDKITEGSCEMSEVVFRTNDPSATVAKWYVEYSNNYGWDYHGDSYEEALDTYVNLFNDSLGDSILLHVWESTLDDGTKETEIVLTSLPEN